MRSSIISFEEFETNILIITKDVGCKFYEYYIQSPHTYQNCYEYAFGCYDRFSRKHLECLIKGGYFEPVDENMFTELFSGEENEGS